MRYERRKEITAIMSIASVLMMGVILSLPQLGLHMERSLWLTLVATVLAGSAASISIMLSRHLTHERNRRRVFLIYAREDVELARKLAADLREHGFRPWLDVDEIAPGQIWKKSVIRALEESAIALVLVSERLQKKGFVQEELKVAFDTLHESEKDFSPVIPVRLDNSPVPDRLAHVQWVNLFEEGGLERLFAGLSKLGQGA